jgi:hypothetical protein
MPTPYVPLDRQDFNSDGLERLSLSRRLYCAWLLSQGYERWALRERFGVSDRDLSTLAKLYGIKRTDLVAKAPPEDIPVYRRSH